MRIARIALMVLTCAAQAACVTQQETLPLSTRAELLRLGKIITNEKEAEETRCNSRILYCDLVREAIQKYGKKTAIGKLWARQAPTQYVYATIYGSEPSGLTVAQQIEGAFKG